MSAAPRRAGTVRAALALTAVALTGTGAWTEAKTRENRPGTSTATVPFALVADRDVADRLPRPEDRYAVAGGCYTIEATGAGYVGEGGALTPDAKAAEPFHFQATELGQYLIATNEGRDTRYEGAWWDVRGYLGAAKTAALPVGSDVEVAAAPSEDADWSLVAVGPEPDAKSRTQAYALSLPSRGEVLTVQDGALALAPATTAAAPLVLRHVADDDVTDADANGTACASWPEVETGASGKPAPVADGEAARVQGFFEAHVHGMAYEFLGGEVRCGQPWHPYGVEHALGNCQEDGNLLNSALEVGLAGQSPADPVTAYDPVGWPTFGYWPQYDTLTHEQYYWRWLERAYLGGLRLTTNLLVDNTALCQAFPQKKNSCNEMDGVRLQAQRLFELQDYVDAQSGGPGEGWLRIVTTPAQARQVINAGRLAIVMGIEVSVLFDCGEVLDQPQCTKAQIDERLQEVFDLGVRQMELINKFDNALSGVTGDGGQTGMVVNSGNRSTTGHYWDMQACPEDVAHDHGAEGDEHDKTQTSPLDATPEQAPEEIDQLAGRILALTAPTKGFVAPVYGKGPHCNTRGLTDLGEHLITRMVEKGMIFDPDHMSASAQRSALDLIQTQLAPTEKKKAKQERRPALRPAIMSSHSWANDVVYQRIYQLDGVVAPRTGDSRTFAGRWAEHKAWAELNAPEGYDFGLGYGADTNGLGGQPGPSGGRTLTYDADGFEAPIGGVRLTQQTSGVKTYDIARDGVAHYGLFADWFQELRLAGDQRGPGQGAELIADMLDGAETYLALWERAVYGGNDCVRDGSMPQVEDLHAALGLNVEGFLTAIGQPASRDGAAYVYCAEDEDGQPVVVDVLFDADGTAAEVVDSASALTVPDASHGHAPAEGEDHLHELDATLAPAVGALPGS